MHMISYISKSRILNEESQTHMRDLASIAQARNRKSGITGVLFLRGSVFFQTIEGPADAVRELFGLISLDERHESIYPLLDEPIAERRFGNWPMETFCDPLCDENFIEALRRLGNHFIESEALNPSSVATYSWRLVAKMARNRITTMPQRLIHN